MKARVMLARFPGSFQEHPKSSNYVRRVFGQCLPKKLLKTTETDNSTVELWSCGHPEISELVLWDLTETPIDMGRNRCIDHAQQMGCDFALMIDADMAPDQQRPGARPFWETAWGFLHRRQHPAAIAAPYVGPGWHQNIYVFRWRGFNNWNKPINFALQQFTREEATERAGIEKVAALPTGLILYDLRIFERARPPYFYYEMDPKRTRKESTEDVTQTRDLSLLWHDVDGAGVYCAWDSWARHVKQTEFGAPDALTTASVGEALHRAWQRGRAPGEGLVMVGDDAPLDRGSDRLAMGDLSDMVKLVREKYPEFVAPQILEPEAALVLPDREPSLRVIGVGPEGGAE